MQLFCQCSTTLLLFRLMTEGGWGNYTDDAVIEITDVVVAKG